MFRFLTAAVLALVGPRARPAGAAFRPGVEALEGRDCPAAYLWQPGLVNGAVSTNGGVAANWDLTGGAQVVRAAVPPGANDALTFGVVALGGVNYGDNGAACALPAGAYGAVAVLSGATNTVTVLAPKGAVTFGQTTVNGGCTFDLNGGTAWDFGTQTWGSVPAAPPTITNGTWTVYKGEIASVANLTLGGAAVVAPGGKLLAGNWTNVGWTATDTADALTVNGYAEFDGGVTYTGNAAGATAYNPLVVGAGGTVQVTGFGNTKINAYVDDYGTFGVAASALVAVTRTVGFAGVATGVALESGSTLALSAGSTLRAGTKLGAAVAGTGATVLVSANPDTQAPATVAGNVQLGGDLVYDVPSRVTFASGAAALSLSGYGFTATDTVVTVVADFGLCEVSQLAAATVALGAGCSFVADPVGAPFDAFSAYAIVGARTGDFAPYVLPGGAAAAWDGTGLDLTFTDPVGGGGQAQ